MNQAANTDTFCHACAEHLARRFAPNRTDNTRVRSYIHAGSTQTSLNIGINVTSVGDYAFLRNRSLSTINMAAAVPPAFKTNINNSFASIANLKNITLNIPSGSETAYANSPWAALNISGVPHNYTVTGITLTSASDVASTNLTNQFAATINGTNFPPQDVTWRLDAPTNPASGTMVSSTGLLIIGANEQAQEFTVRATSLASPQNFAAGVPNFATKTVARGPAVRVTNPTLAFADHTTGQTVTTTVSGTITNLEATAIPRLNASIHHVSGLQDVFVFSTNNSTQPIAIDNVLPNVGRSVTLRAFRSGTTNLTLGNQHVGTHVARVNLSEPTGRVLASFTVSITVSPPAPDLVSAAVTVSAPVVGGTPATTYTGGNANFSGSVSWNPSASGTFAGGTQYTAIVSLTAAQGFRFVSGMTATINGFAATITSRTDSAVTFQYQFPATALAINAASVTAVTPTAGAAPNTDATITTPSPQFTASAVQWLLSNNTVFTGTEFASNTVYRARITLTANSGYNFPANATAANFNINGNSATTIDNNTGGSIRLTFSFPATRIVLAITSPTLINDTYTYPEAVVGYNFGTSTSWNAANNITFTVRNTGNAATNQLTVAASPSNRLTLTRNTSGQNDIHRTGGIPAGETREFQIRPVNGLAAGTYTTTITITGGNVQTVTITVNFIVHAAAPTQVSAAHIGIEEPLTGNAPNTAASIQQGTGFTVGTVAWSPVANPFLGNTQYTATVILTANTGFTFNNFNNSNARVNGDLATVTNNTQRTITLSYAFDATAGTSIKSASINIQNTPVTGATTNPNATIAAQDPNPSFRIQSATWSVGANAFSDSHFLGGTAYTINVTLITIDDEYTFRGLTSVLLNNNTIPITSANISGVGGRTLTLAYAFPATNVSITSAMLSVAAPVTAATPATVPDVTIAQPANFSIISVTWNTSPVRFRESTVYTVTMVLSANSGFTFAGLETARINTLNATVTNNTGMQVTLSYTFPVTQEALTVSESGLHIFDELVLGYVAGDRTPLTVEIANIGSQTISSINISLGGTNASRFTLSTDNIANLNAGGSVTFTVIPNNGVPRGTYNATVTISGDILTSRTFNVRFVVSAGVTSVVITPGEAAMRLANGSTFTFSAAVFGISPSVSQSVTWSLRAGSTSPHNQTGISLAGVLTINNGNAQNGGTIIVRATSTTDTAIFGEATVHLVSTAITVARINAAAPTSGAPVAQPTIGTATPTNSYAIQSTTWSVNGEPFAGTHFVGGTVYTLTVTLLANATHTFQGITNTNVTINGSTATQRTNNSGRTITLALEFPATDSPITGISIHTQPSRITYNHGNNLDLTGLILNVVSPTGTEQLPFVNFASQGVVSTPVHGSALNTVGETTVTLSFQGHTATFTIQVNANTIASVVLTIAAPVTGARPVTSISHAQYTGVITWSPDNNPFVGGFVYTATVTITALPGNIFNISSVTLNGSAIPVTVVDGTVIFSQAFPQTEVAPVYGISVDQIEIDFYSAVIGYSAVSQSTVTIINTGNRVTGALTITLTGDDSFALSLASISDIVVGGTVPFTIAPKLGLGVGQHIAIITISGGNGISQIIHVYFVVTPAPTYGIELRIDNAQIGHGQTYTFAPVAFGYSEQDALVTITNTGNQDIDSLDIAISGVNANAFVLSATFIDFIHVGESAFFLIVPHFGLAVDTYVATITVSGAHGISRSFNISFAVNPVTVTTVNVNVTAPVYGAMPSNTATTIGQVNYAVDSVTWNTDGTFGYDTEYIVTITLMADDNYAFVISSMVALVNGQTARIVSNDGSSVTFAFTFPALLEPATYSISLAPSNNHTFPAAPEGYGAQAAHVIIITNTGTHATSQLTIELSGANQTAFVLSPSTLEGIAPGAQRSFSVAPSIGLGVGAYSATVTVTGNNGISANFNVSFTVTALSTYGIVITSNTDNNPITSHAFTATNFGYGAQTAITFRVRNTGNQATGALTIARDGSGAISFTISPTASIASVAVGANGTFTVRPNTGLNAGTYTAIIKITGGNGISADLEVTFTVNPVGVSVSLSGLNGTGAHTFATQLVGYAANNRPTLTVTVTNGSTTVTIPGGTLSVTISGNDSNRFAITANNLNNSLATSGNNRSRTFAIRPNADVHAGTYTATVRVSSTNSNYLISSHSFTMTFVVNLRPISLSETGTFTFEDRAVGDTPPVARSIVITNGNTATATGILSVALSGPNASSFALSTGSIASITTNTTQNQNNRTFTVRPNPGLPAGTHTATVMVQNRDAPNNVTTQTFNVSFTVTSDDIDVSTHGTHKFTDVARGYAPVTPHSVSVTNIGNRETGQLTVTLSGADADAFELSHTVLASLGIGGNTTFTVVPSNGLAVGTYNATVTIMGDYGISHFFGISLTVNPTHIATAIISVQPPTPGTMPSNSATASPEVDFEIISVTWDTGTPFEYGSEYTVTITLRADENCAFATTLTVVTINGKSANVVSNNGFLLTLSYKFPAMLPAAIALADVNGDMLASPFVFTGVTYGYTQKATLTVTVINTGTDATGQLTVTLSGAHATGFTLSTDSIANIMSGSSTTFTITQNIGLNAGTYTAMVTVSDGQSIAESLQLTFTVGKASPPPHGVPAVVYMDKVLKALGSDTDELKLQDIKLPAGWTWSFDNIDDVLVIGSSHTFKARFEETDNYYAQEVDVTFTLLEAEPKGGRKVTLADIFMFTAIGTAVLGTTVIYVSISMDKKSREGNKGSNGYKGTKSKKPKPNKKTPLRRTKPYTY